MKGSDSLWVAQVHSLIPQDSEASMSKTNEPKNRNKVCKIKTKLFQSLIRAYKSETIFQSSNLIKIS